MAEFKKQEKVKEIKPEVKEENENKGKICGLMFDMGIFLLTYLTRFLNLG